jgi:acyl carrier protein
MDTQDLIRRFVAENFLFNPNGTELDANTSFLEAGIVDSLGIMELVHFVEERFGIPVGDEEVVPANFDSVNRLAAFVQAKGWRGR